MSIYTLHVNGPDAAMAPAAQAVLGVIWPLMDVFSESLPHPWEVYLHPLRNDPAFVRTEPGALHFNFHDQGGEIDTFNDICERWFALVVAASVDRLDTALAKLRVATQAVPSLQEELDRPHYRLMRLGTTIGKIGGYDGHLALMTDGVYEELEGEDAERARQLQASDGTEDPVERNLRPADAIRQRFLSELPSATGDELTSLAWYIGHMAYPGPLTAALLQRAPLAPQAVETALRRLGGRAAIEADVEQGLAAPVEAIRAAALQAVVPLIRRDRVEPALGARWLLEAMDRGLREQQIAAEALGWFDPGALRPIVVERLCAAIGGDAALEHAAVLGLFNLHLNGDVPAPVVEVFKAVAGREGPAQALARIALRRAAG